MALSGDHVTTDETRKEAISKEANQMNGWKVTPSFSIPEGFELREDTDHFYVYKREQLAAVFNWAGYTSVAKVRADVLKVCSDFEGGK